jgi:hypothetical protein
MGNDRNPLCLMMVKNETDGFFDLSTEHFSIQVLPHWEDGGQGNEALSCRLAEALGSAGRWLRR